MLLPQVNKWPSLGRRFGQNKQGTNRHHFGGGCRSPFLSERAELEMAQKRTVPPLLLPAASSHSHSSEFRVARRKVPKAPSRDALNREALTFLLDLIPPDIEAPTAIQRSRALQIVNLLTTIIATLPIGTERDDMNNMLLQYTSISAPIHRLSTEIICKIFLEVLLVQTPSEWNNRFTLNIDVDLSPPYGRPEKCNKKQWILLLKCIIKHSTRWQTAMDYPNALQILRGIKGRIPRLEKLDLQCYEPPLRLDGDPSVDEPVGDLDMFSPAPALYDVKSKAPICAASPWPQLTRYTVETRLTGLHLENLHLATSLETLSIPAHCHQPLPADVILLPRVHTLINSVETGIPFLFILPALRNISITNLFLPSLLHLLERSCQGASCQLESLTVSSWCDIPTLYEVLRRSPTLLHLRILLDRNMSTPLPLAAALCEILTLTDTPHAAFPDRSVLKNLLSVNIRVFPADFDRDLFLGMVRSHWRAPDMPRLRSVALCSYSLHYNLFKAPQKAEVERFREEGLDITFRN
ncbi:hypothetical protein C8J57DRAFT_1461652 [Mycena rebaudengoi]|nr:hypothetical protein C8J57DRAFT_1461652 [Mycena rebaudengoi]